MIRAPVDVQVTMHLCRLVGRGAIRQIVLVDGEVVANTRHRRVVAHGHGKRAGRGIAVAVGRGVGERQI